MGNSIFDSDFYADTVKREYRHACMVYLISEPIFMTDCKGLGLDKKQLRKSLKANLKKLKKALLGKGGIFNDFFDDHPTEIEKEEEKIKLSSFVYDLYNILTLAVYFDYKYVLKAQKNKTLDKELLFNNLALSIIEGSVIGRYESFKPYFGRTYSWQVGDIEHGVPITKLFKSDNGSKNYLDNFYYAQNTFLLHELLMLVVLYHRDKIRPKKYYTKVVQKNIITKDIETTTSSVPDNYLDDHKWSSSLINIITNFDYIMSDLKSKKKPLHRAKLANIFFSKEFIDNFDFNQLLKSYVFNEKLMTEKIPTEINITETIGRIIDSKIQKYTDKKKAWSHVVKFMKFFLHPVRGQKNKSTDFSDGKHICIYNHHHTFGITIGDIKRQDRIKLTYEELHDKVRRNKDNATSRVAHKRQLRKKPHKNKVSSQETGKNLTRKELRNKFKILIKKDSTTSQVRRERLTDRISANKDRHFKLIRSNEYFLDTYLF